MSKKSGAGINLIFFVLVLLLAGALTAIGAYAYFHKPEHEAKPVSAPLVTETSEETTTTAGTTVSTAKTTASTTIATTSVTTTTTASSVSKLEYHEYNETIAADAAKAVLTLTKEESGDLFHYYPNSEWTFSSFSDKAVVGLDKGKDGSSASYYINGAEVRSSKSDIGFTAEIKDGRTLKAESYGGELSELRIVSNNNKYAKLGYTADIKSGTLEADLYSGSYPNGIYVINAEYLVGDKTCDLNIYLFVNCKSDDEKDYSFYLCNCSQGSAEVTTAATEPASSETTTKKAD
ncbi:MAG: hypothetical protein IKP78_07630 [Ruminococcus sp.]|nr:hypothetical protein [Ruminococcus sp.]